MSSKIHRAALPVKVNLLLSCPRSFLSEVILGVTAPHVALTAARTLLSQAAHFLYEFQINFPHTMPDTTLLLLLWLGGWLSLAKVKRWEISDVTAMVRITSLMGGGSWGLRTVIQQSRLGQIARFSPTCPSLDSFLQLQGAETFFQLLGTSQLQACSLHLILLSLKEYEIWDKGSWFKMFTAGL